MRKSIAGLVLFAVFFAVICPVMKAGEKSGHDRAAAEKAALDKEAKRAGDAVGRFSDTGRLEKKFAFLKDDHAEEYEALMNAMKQAESAWKAVAEKAATASSHSELSDLKNMAYTAEQEFYIREMELKMLGSVKDRAKLAEKYGSDEVSAMSRELEELDRKKISAYRTKLEAEKVIRESDSKIRELQKSLHEEIKAARQAKKDAAGKAEKKAEK